MSISSKNVLSNVPPSHASAAQPIIPLALQTLELSKEVFIEKFGNYLAVTTDEFEYLPAEEGKVVSLNSRAIADCITLFGIGNDKSVFAFHTSTVQPDPERTETDEEIVMTELNDFFEDYDDEVKLLQFNIYLVGGNGFEPSINLYNGLLTAIPKFFNNPVISGEFMNPTKSQGKTFITANLNANGELHYYFHDEQLHNESGYSSSGDESNL
jgi:hypothetical protein